MSISSSFLGIKPTESFIIHDVGFRLSKVDKTKLRNDLYQFELRTPSASKVKFIVRKFKNLYEGKLVVNGLDIKFYQKSFGSSPYSVYKELEKRIDKDLIDWKKKRFLYRRDKNLMTAKQEVSL